MSAAPAQRCARLPRIVRPNCASTAAADMLTEASVSTR
jgi:hypothetical protein